MIRINDSFALLGVLLIFEGYFMNIRFVVVDVIFFSMNHVQLRHELCMRLL